MRVIWTFVVLTLCACGPSERGGERTPDADEGGSTCTGLECSVVQCEKMGKPPTTLSGTVYAPNGTLALYGATVYVPSLDPGPVDDGVTCGKCAETLPGGSIVNTLSDTTGKFTLSGVPSGSQIPLIVSIGKWRRKAVIPQVLPCQDNPLPSTITSLPRNKTEGDIPKLAVTTGSWDALECLMRKIGVSDSEFTNDSGSGRIHLYHSNGSPKIHPTGEMLAEATTLWANMNKLKDYDMVLFSCEGGPYPEKKSQAMMDNVKEYADLGGRVFLTHYHSVWIEGEKDVPGHAPAVWPGVAKCDIDTQTNGTGVIDQVSNPKGSAFAQWMTSVGGSFTPGAIVMEADSSRQSCSSVDMTQAERWVYMKIDGVDYPQNFQFTTPLESPTDDRCGKVVFSDMHVASGSTSDLTGFPDGCSTEPMTPQEKALAFMLFDIATCVGPIL